MTSPEIRLSRKVRERLSQEGDRFLRDILQEELRIHPSNLAALADLGHALTRLGQHEQGLEIDRRLVRMAPADPVPHYNLACSLALLGRRDEALDALERAAELGYSDADHLVADEDLASLRGERRFDDLLRRLRGAAATQG